MMAKKHSSLFPFLFGLLTVAVFVSSISSPPLEAQSMVDRYYPMRTDMQRASLKGRVESVFETSRNYNPTVERWEPIARIVARKYDRDGRLTKEAILVKQEPVEKAIYQYDSAQQTARPIMEVTMSNGASADSTTLLVERLFAYDETGRVQVMIYRDHSTRKTTLFQYHYASSEASRALLAIVEKDSATGYIRQIEIFHHFPDMRPAGSTIRQFDITRDHITTLADTTKIPASHVMSSYTVFSYDDNEAPIIFLAWDYGNDTIIDRKQSIRYDPDTMKLSMMEQVFRGKDIVSSTAQIFNPFGDVLSSANSYGNDTVYQRAYDYVYDAVDESGNWTNRRQYVAKDPGNPESTDRLLMNRIDRSISYYKE